MRFAKIVRWGQTRTEIGVDLSNLVELIRVVPCRRVDRIEQANGGSWNNPWAVFTPRFVRLNFTVNF